MYPLTGLGICTLGKEICSLHTFDGAAVRTFLLRVEGLEDWRKPDSERILGHIFPERMDGLQVGVISGNDNRYLLRPLF